MSMESYFAKLYHVYKVQSQRECWPEWMCQEAHRELAHPWGSEGILCQEATPWTMHECPIS